MTYPVPANFFNGSSKAFMTVLDGIDFADTRVSGVRFRTVFLPVDESIAVLSRWEPGFPLSVSEKERLVREIRPLCDRLMVRLSVSPDDSFIVYVEAKVMDLSPHPMGASEFHLAYREGAAANWPADPILPGWAARHSIEQTYRETASWDALRALVVDLESDAGKLDRNHRGAIAAMEDSAEISRKLVTNFLDDLEEKYDASRGDLELAMIGSIQSQPYFFLALTDLLVEAVDRDVIGAGDANDIVSVQGNLIEEVLNGPYGPGMDTDLVCRLVSILEEYDTLLAAPAEWESV